MKKGWGKASGLSECFQLFVSFNASTLDWVTVRTCGQLKICVTFLYMCSSGSGVGGKLRRNWLTQIHLENGGGYANSDNVVIILLFLQSYLNTSQMSAVSCITNAVLQPYASSKICLLQGPPGTGKSLTAVSLIKNILAQVLICSEQCFFVKNIFSGTVIRWQSM